ncbi:MAG: cell division protein FtsX, partial [Rhodothermales bacterium]|jgi:cell division transport system permease protein
MLPYSIKEGLAGFRRASFSSVAATSAMTAALVMVGLFAIVTWQARGISEWLKQRVGEVELFLEDTSDTVAVSLFERARSTPGVAQAEFISKERAQEIFRQEFGEEADIFFDGTFLPASIRVRVEPDYINADSLSVLVAEFASWNRVDEVVFNQALLTKVESNLRLISLIGISIGALVLLASVFLVANTIRLAIYARRLMIRTMKLVGATDGFIRKPFIVEGVIQGFLSSILALFLLWFIQRAAMAYVPQLEPLALPEVLVFSVVLTGSGCALGWMGSASAVGRFLKHISLH